uniref:transposase n=1 Tax=Caldicellulosiruptor morganii TaxID=1387555 RepID=UPI000D5285E4
MVSDDVPGIIDTIKIAYPYADLEFAFVHLQRNVKRHMTKEDSSKFNKELEKIRLSSSDIDEAVSAFNQLCNEYTPKISSLFKRTFR